MNATLLTRIPAIALSGALTFAVPCLAQPATGSATSPGVNAPNSTANGTTSGPAAGSPVANSMPATPHQSKVIKGHGKMRTAQKTRTHHTKHVKGTSGTESGAAPKTE